MAEIPNLDEVTPGATVLWFGKHNGRRLDEIGEASRRGLLHIAKEKQYIPNAGLAVILVPIPE